MLASAHFSTSTRPKFLQATSAEPMWPNATEPYEVSPGQLPGLLKRKGVKYEPLIQPIS
jgi:hypothetical protein